MGKAIWIVLFGTILAWAPVGVALAQVCLECPPFAPPCVRSAQDGNPWCEDFEMFSGPNPQCYDTQGCTTEPEIPIGCNGWRPWDDDPNTLGVVSCDQNHTEGGAQSLALDADDDMVRVFEGYDLAASPLWILTVHVYIPSTMSNRAFWIANPDYNLDLVPWPTWAIQCWMSAEEGIIHDDFGGGELPLITDQWVELRADINLFSDRVYLFYDGQLLGLYPWTVGGGSLQIEAIDLYSDNASRFYWDDFALCPAWHSDNRPPELRCRTIERLDSGCVDYFWSLRGGGCFFPTGEFYIDIEAGDGARVCNELEDMTPPDGWEVELCAGYTNGHALWRFTPDGPEIPCVEQVTGRLRVDPNGATETVTDTGLVVPPYSVLLHAARRCPNPDARCDGTFDWGPTTQLPIPCFDDTDCEDFGEMPCVDGFCEGILRSSYWSSPTTVCTAYLPVPAMTTWAKAVLALLLLGGGALLVLRSRALPGAPAFQAWFTWR